MFRQAMHMLAADDATETLLLVSKPPAPEVVASLADDLPEGKRVVAAFVGWEGGEAPFEIHDTLEAAARAAAGTARRGSRRQRGCNPYLYNSPHTGAA